MKRWIVGALILFGLIGGTMWFLGIDSTADKVLKTGETIAETSIEDYQGYQRASEKAEKLRFLNLLLRDAKVMRDFAKVPPPPGSDIIRECAIVQQKYAEDCISYENSVFGFAPPADKLLERHTELQNWLLRLKDDPDILYTK
jgi:hypothetical protein